MRPAARLSLMARPLQTSLEGYCSTTSGQNTNIHQDTKGVLKTKSCVTKPISLGFVVHRGLLQNPLWMSGANAQPCLSPPISHGAHLETSSGSPEFKCWDVWGFQLPGLISSIKSAIFPFFNSPVGCFSSLSGPLFIHFLIV